MSKSRKLKLDKEDRPLPTNVGDEIYPNGIFHFNISRILEHINSRELIAEKERIHVNEWFKTHFRGSVNEEHLQRSILQNLSYKRKSDQVCL
jgi:hypothetical protein